MSRLFTAVICVVFCSLPLLFCQTTRRTSRVPDQKIKVDGSNHWFVDHFGRVRLFHGVNAVQKSFPWYPASMLNDTRLDDLARYGMNVVRLGTMWSGVEPEEGRINDTYIGILRDIILRLADRGIYTILDMHQDVLSSLYESYDGVPLWLMETFPEPTNPYPWPLDSVDMWAEGYLTQACSEGFQFFYNNTNDSVDKWANFWVVVAERLGRDIPAVLGYEYMNEPWAGDYFADPSLILPGEAGKVNLLPLYDYLNEVIRRYDEKSIQFYEPVTWGVVFDNEHEYAGSGFDRVPGGWYYEDVSALSYHTYCWWLDVVGSDATDEERLEAIDNCTNHLLPRIFQTTANDVNTTGGTSILTEFGLCKDVGTEINIECGAYMDLADQWLQSWVYWDYLAEWYNADGSRDMDRIGVHTRAYAQAVAGTPLSMYFNASTLEFTLKYRPTRGIDEPTEIYVPSLHYGTGYVVQTTPVGVSWSATGDIVYVVYDGPEPDFPDVIEVFISPIT